MVTMRVFCSIRISTQGSKPFGCHELMDELDGLQELLHPLQKISLTWKESQQQHRKPFKELRNNPSKKPSKWVPDSYAITMEQCSLNDIL